MKNFHLRKLIFGLLFLIISGVQAQSVNQRASNPRLDSLRNEKDTLKLKEKLLRLSNSNKEEDLTLAFKYYNATNQELKAEEIFEMAKKKFPKGEYSYSTALNRIVSEKDPVKKEIILKDLLRDFHEKIVTDDIDMYRFDVAARYAEAKNKDKSAEYALQINANKHPDYLFIIADILYQKGLLETSAKISNDAMGAIKKIKTPETGKTVGDPYSVQNSPLTYYYKYLNLYSKIMAQTGKTQEALQYAKEAFEYNKNNNKEDLSTTENYVSLLGATGSYSEGLTITEKYIKKGNATEKMKGDFKTAYTKINGVEGYQAYYNSLQGDLKKQIVDEVSKKMINEKAPDFVLKDLKGVKVSLADLKGKVVIIDFWATWCGPCKKSFPAMQRAVNKYKNDPKVKFLFVHTWEKEENPVEDVRKFMKDSKYTFDVYMDLKDPVTKSNKVVSSFKVSGIPAKFIIDGNGTIRYKMTGFSGGDDAAVEEVSAMIEMARKSI